MVDPGNAALGAHKAGKCFIDDVDDVLVRRLRGMWRRTAQGVSAQPGDAVLGRPRGQADPPILNWIVSHVFHSKHKSTTRGTGHRSNETKITSVFDYAEGV
jgi:hypothetical protein